MSKYIIILEQPRDLACETAVEAMAAAGMQPADARRAWRRQRGVLMRSLSEDMATKLAEALILRGIDALAVPDVDYPSAPALTRVGSLRIDEDALTFPSLRSTRVPDHLSMDDVLAVQVGLILAEDQHSLSDVERHVMDGSLDKDDQRALTQRSIDSVLNPSFSLTSYLKGDPEEQVNFERVRKERSELSRRQKRLRRFDPPEEKERFISEHPGLRGILHIGTRDRVYRVEGESAAFGHGAERTAGHWLRAMHVAVQRLMEGAPSAQMPESTMSFFKGSDRGDYVYSDALAVDEELRWIYAERVWVHGDSKIPDP